jgi:hypothetical protein
MNQYSCIPARNGYLHRFTNLYACQARADPFLPYFFDDFPNERVEKNEVYKGEAINLRPKRLSH